MMTLVKQLSFAPLVLVSIAIFCLQLRPILSSYDFIFSLSIDTAIKLILCCSFLILTSLFFIIFITLAQSFKLILPIILITSLLPLLILSFPESLSLSFGIALFFLASLMQLLNKLKTYLTFQPTVILSPSVKSLTSFLIIILSLSYYLSISSQIQKNGFQVPETLIDTAIKFANPSGSQFVKGEKYLAQLPNVTQEQIDLLKQHPELLKQYNLTPEALDNLKPQTSKRTDQSSEIEVPTLDLKSLIKSQLDTMLKPYQQIIPIVLSSLFFSILMSINWILSIFISPILFLIFKILEKSGFIHFEKEMREVKKLVV